MIVYGENSVTIVLEKAIKIVEMIKEARSRRWSKEGKLIIYDNTSDPFHPVRLMNKREDIESDINRYTNIENRLIQYYDNTMMKLIPDVISRSCPSTINPII